MRTREQLKMMQSSPLSVKVRLTQDRIRQWVREYGEDGVYISFSGGKDSTVLCDIIDKMYPDNTIPKVFVNTGLEYPEIVQFIKTKSNVVILRPKKNFKQVVTDYGYPFVSKEVSGAVAGARRYIKKALDTKGQYSKFSPSPSIDEQAIAEFSRGGGITSIAKLEELANTQRKINEETGKQWAGFRFMQMMGNLPKKDNGDRSQFSCEKWQFLLEAPFPIDSKCCSVMKKAPIHSYAHKTGRHPITGQMASESRLRAQQWIRNGCNGFQMKEPISNPMSFWTEQDVLRYIKENNIEICSVYGDIVEVNEEQLEGQMSLADFGLDTLEGKKLKTTGCDRTGCVFCAYGCHLEKAGEGRFERLKVTHPKLYEYLMKPTSEGGLGYKEIIDWLNEHGKLNIRY